MNPDLLTPHYYEINRLSLENDWDTLEHHFYQLALRVAGSSVASQIQEVDLTAYTSAVARFFKNQLSEMSFHGIKGLFFEFDLENGWRGTLYICDRYNPSHAGNDTWAKKWFQKAAGPRLAEFARLYQELGDLAGVEDSKVTAGLYLIARTIAAVGRAFGEAPLTRASICVGHTGQKHLSRIYERAEYTG